MTVKITNNSTAKLNVGGANIDPKATVGIDENAWKIAQNSNAVKAWLNTPVEPGGDVMILSVEGDDADAGESKPATKGKGTKGKKTAGQDASGGQDQSADTTAEDAAAPGVPSVPAASE